MNGDASAAGAGGGGGKGGGGGGGKSASGGATSGGKHAATNRLPCSPKALSPNRQVGVACIFSAYLKLW